MFQGRTLALLAVLGVFNGTPQACRSGVRAGLLDRPVLLSVTSL
jgi:hypothetical protein